MKELRQFIASIICIGYGIAVIAGNYHGTNTFNLQVLGLLWLIISLI